MLDLEMQKYITVAIYIREMLNKVNKGGKWRQKAVKSDVKASTLEKVFSLNLILKEAK